MINIFYCISVHSQYIKMERKNILNEVKDSHKTSGAHVLTFTISHPKINLFSTRLGFNGSGRSEADVDKLVTMAHLLLWLLVHAQNTNQSCRFYQLKHFQNLKISPQKFQLHIVERCNDSRTRFVKHQLTLKGL